jgi:hypothetical protein
MDVVATFPPDAGHAPVLLGPTARIALRYLRWPPSVQLSRILPLAPGSMRGQGRSRAEQQLSRAMPWRARSTPPDPTYQAFLPLPRSCRRFRIKRKFEDSCPTRQITLSVVGDGYRRAPRTYPALPTPCRPHRRGDQGRTALSGGTIRGMGPRTGAGGAEFRMTASPGPPDGPHGPRNGPPFCRLRWQPSHRSQTCKWVCSRGGLRRGRQLAKVAKASPVTPRGSPRP